MCYQFRQQLSSKREELSQKTAEAAQREAELQEEMSRRRQREADLQEAANMLRPAVMVRTQPDHRASSSLLHTLQVRLRTLSLRAGAPHSCDYRAVQDFSTRLTPDVTSTNFTVAVT